MKYYICTFCENKRAQNTINHYSCYHCKGNFVVCRKCSCKIDSNVDGTYFGIARIVMKLHNKEFHSSVDIV